MMRSAAIAAALVAVWSAAASAEERGVPLKDAAGHEIVAANCGGCHSLDYIQTNAPFMTRKVWEAEVTKMIKVFGAPIEEPEAKTIIDYLTRNYGSAG